MLNSKIKSKKPIKFGQILAITSRYSPNRPEYEEGLRNARPNITQEELSRELLELDRRDSYYNAIMDEVARSYEFDLDEEEINRKIDELTPEIGGDQQESIRHRVSIFIKKKLIYDDLANDWEIAISDDHVKDTLDKFYRETGNPIKEYLDNSDKFEEVRAHIREQLITERLMNAFKPMYNFQNSEENSL